MIYMVAAAAGQAPTWSYFVPLAGALITGLVAIGPLVVAVLLLKETQRTNRITEKWRRREETARQLRWAAEQAGLDEERKGVAVVVLTHLFESDMLEPPDVDLVRDVLYKIYDRGVTALG